MTVKHKSGVTKKTGRGRVGAGGRSGKIVSRSTAKKPGRAAAVRRASGKTSKVHVGRDTKRQALKVSAAKSTAVEEARLKDTEVMEGEMDKVRESVSDPHFLDYISKNVGIKANDIINILIEGPRVDDKVSEILSLKLNETRRMLNMLNNYGVVRYTINKNSDGWLTFVWYLDADAVTVLNGKVKAELSARSVLPQDCNDFFVCKNCSKKHSMVLQFEVAFENKFRCECGKPLIRVSKERAEELYKNVVM